MVTVERAADVTSVPPDDAVTAATAPVAAPRLTRLELQGFKSFATRTTFSFEPGITAVIGPNGSGKSNVADAIRWVLGETSQSALRGKKTEDVIFAGGSGRAPAGMAEVAVTFDNRTGWLQTPFSEVTVSRRAFRSGETQYLINGRRVRLKDVHTLTASLGQSHTVVGQGLVDAALSLRAEDRRSLFEHAADLSGLRIKAVEAERSLTEADANVTRLEDLLAELGPRLRTLERSARQAREWQGLHDRLVTLQRTHYRSLLRAAKGRLAEAEREDLAARTRDEAGQAEAERARVAAAAARNAVEDARAALALHDVHVQEAADQARQVAHARDLAAERHAALTRRLRDMVDTRSGLDEQVEAVTAEVGAVGASLMSLSAQVEAARAEVARLADEVSRISEARAGRERERDRLGRDLRDAERAATDLERRRALLDQRAETDAAEAERARAALAARLARIAALDADLAATGRAGTADEAAGADLDREIERVAGVIDRLATEESAARETVTAIDRRRDQAISRLEVLRRMRESGTGLYAGVRATLQAAEAGTLAGVRGALSSLVEVDSPHETAIEVALGGHVQDVVVETWAHAEAAIAFLKRQNAGRVTFQPLDSVRGVRPSAPPDALLGAPGVIGVATDLVRAAPDLAAVVGGLLGRTLVVDDLPAARASLSRLPGGWSTVTLRGEIARSGGSVTGGSAARESGTLVRERDLRELPRAIAALDEERAASAAAFDRTSGERQRQEAERQRLTIARAALVAARAERERERGRLTKWLADLHRERGLDERRLETTEAAAAAREEERAAIARDEDRVSEEIATLRARYEVVSAGSSDDGTALVAAERALGDARQTLTALDERHRAERRREASLRARATALSEELTQRRERLARVEGELGAVAGHLERLAAEAERVDRAREDAVAGRAPREARFRQAQRDADRAGQVAEAARAAAQDHAAARGAVALLTERARGEVATVEQRIRDDLDVDDPARVFDHDLYPEPVAAGAGDAAGDDATMTGLATGVTEAVGISSDHSGAGEIVPGGGGDAGEDEPEPTAEAMAAAEREIARLRERLRRVGYVGEDAVTEFERESAHHAFLQGQIADVHGAAAALRGLLADLKATMRARFAETFDRVAVAFAETFTTLFGGGTAQLVMAEGSDEGEGGGIDIVARPPGKRLQSLALLSGGERALTAAALLIAILRVNPTPFCLLDEVDAALDEANVVRFRDQLTHLARETQIIVITHNRGTIEIADTLYGVSMGGDGVSRLLSMRLSGGEGDEAG